MTNRWCPNIFENSVNQQFCLFVNNKIVCDKGLRRFVDKVEEVGVRGIRNHKHLDFPLVVPAFLTDTIVTQAMPVLACIPEVVSSFCAQGKGRSKLSRDGINQLSKYRQNLRPGFLLAFISIHHLEPVDSSTLVPVAR